MLGYYGLPEETARALRNGWLHTGDVGRLDADGFLYVVERKKDLIIRGGFNVYPREVEDVLYAHPAVAEAAVVGVREVSCEHWRDDGAGGARRRPVAKRLLVALVLDLVGEVVDRLTDLPLRLAESLAELARSALGAPLGLELRIVQRLTRLFLDVALGFLGLALDLVAIHECPSVSDLGPKKTCARRLPAAVFVPFRYTRKR